MASQRRIDLSQNIARAATRPQTLLQHIMACRYVSGYKKALR